MTPLRSALREYISLRRDMGYKFQNQEKRLAKFVTFMEERRSSTITYKLAIQWATQPADRHATWSLRLTDVRGFARYLQGIGIEAEIPPTEALPGLRRSKPYVYTDAEVRKLLAAALALPPPDALRRWTYYNLFGLLAVTGLRISEALSLRNDDVDLEMGCSHHSFHEVRQVSFGATPSDVCPQLTELCKTARHPYSSPSKPVLLCGGTRWSVADPVRPQGILAPLARNGPQDAYRPQGSSTA